MLTKIKEVPRPNGLMRLLLRLPIWLFHAHLGWLLGERFLLLTHTGRKSGLPRQTVLEVIQHDRASDIYCVFSPWNEHADWELNIKKAPQVVINVGNRRFNALATPLSGEAAELKVLDYARRYPFAIRLLPRLMGYRVDGSEADFRAFARLGTVVAFQPTSLRKERIA